MVKAVEIQGLSHKFADGTMGLSDVSLTIESGEFVVIAGRNGSGKTSLLRHLNGLMLPSQGTVKIMGNTVSDDLPRARRLVGMIFQNPDSQIVGETVQDDAAFGPENLGLARTEINTRVRAALQAAGLTDLADHRPHTLSGGEKRRLAIAGVLAMDPEILVFDEPFSSLDFPGVRQVLEQMSALHRSGKTIIVATHDLEKIAAQATRLIVLDKGRVERDGPFREILKEVEAFGVREPLASKLGIEVDSWLK